MAGLRPGFGRGGTTHSLFVKVTGPAIGGDEAAGRPFVDDGANGARALGAPSEVGEAALDEVDMATI